MDKENFEKIIDDFFDVFEKNNLDIHDRFSFLSFMLAEIATKVCDDENKFYNLVQTFTENMYKHYTLRKLKNYK